MNETERIIALSDAFGPSGFEDEVAEIVKEELKNIGTLERDSLMNHRMILNPESTGPKVMLDAHMDEVGVIVQAVKPNGTMKFLTLGGWSAPNLPSSAFRLRNGKGEYVKAAVAAKPPHFASRQTGMHRLRSTIWFWTAAVSASGRRKRASVWGSLPRVYLTSSVNTTKRKACSTAKRSMTGSVSLR